MTDKLTRIREVMEEWHKNSKGDWLFGEDDEDREAIAKILDEPENQEAGADSPAGINEVMMAHHATVAVPSKPGRYMTPAGPVVVGAGTITATPSKAPKGEECTCYKENIGGTGTLSTQDCPKHRPKECRVYGSHRFNTVVRWQYVWGTGSSYPSHRDKSPARPTEKEARVLRCDCGAHLWDGNTVLPPDKIET